MLKIHFLIHDEEVIFSNAERVDFIKLGYIFINIKFCTICQSGFISFQNMENATNQRHCKRYVVATVRNSSMGIYLHRFSNVLPFFPFGP